MTFHLVVRRLHLYLAMFLLPWFFVYGLSSAPFSHPDYFEKRFSGRPMWTTRFDRPYEIAIPPNGDLERVGAQILRDAGLEGAHGVYRPNPREVHVFWHTFWKSARLIYYPEQKRLLAEDRRFRWDHFLTGMHARGGFEQSGFLNDAWAVLVDVVQIGILLWIASGLYMWWKIPHTRRWGWLALSGGMVLFVVFLMTL